jgi:hypothetical protein
MKSNIQEYLAARAALSVIKSLGRGFAVVAGGLFSVFVAVLRADVSNDASHQDNNGTSLPGSYRWPHDTPSDVHDYNS